MVAAWLVIACWFSVLLCGLFSCCLSVFVVNSVVIIYILCCVMITFN